MKRKILILGILVAFATNALFSQDLIIKNDKSEIKAKVIEIQEASIKYKLFDFQEGPLRSISTSDVFMIIYESGRRETFGTAEEEKPIQSPINSFSQEVSASSYYPLRAFARISGQAWHNEGLSKFFGTNALYGIGIEKQISNHFKFGADFDFTSKTKDEITFTYNQFGGFVKYSFADFSSTNILFYSELGIKGISLKGVDDNSSLKGSGIGFSALIGLEIPLGEKVLLNLGWNSVFSNINFDGENVDVGNEIFSGGLIFNLW